MKKRLATFILPLTFLSLNSCQTNAPAPEPDRFAKADVNHDGKISLNEATNYYVTEIFLSRDANHDGKLTWEEWHVPGGSESKAKFNAADTNHDGVVTLAEAQAYARKVGLYKQQFREADTNHDGYVTREEAQAYTASKEGSPQ